MEKLSYAHTVVQTPDCSQISPLSLSINDGCYPAASASLDAGFPGDDIPEPEPFTAESDFPAHSVISISGWYSTFLIFSREASICR